MGLVEVLVASVLMAVALVVLLGSLSSLLLGSRVAERRTVEERLARWQIEHLMAGDTLACSIPKCSKTVDHVKYTIATNPIDMPGYVEFDVTVSDGAGSLTLTNAQVTPL